MRGPPPLIAEEPRRQAKNTELEPEVLFDGQARPLGSMPLITAAASHALTLTTARHE